MVIEKEEIKKDSVNHFSERGLVIPVGGVSKKLKGIETNIIFIVFKYVCKKIKNSQNLHNNSL